MNRHPSLYRPALWATLIAGLVAALLALLYTQTADRIAAHAQARTKALMQEIFVDAAHFTPQALAPRAAKGTGIDAQWQVRGEHNEPLGLLLRGTTLRGYSGAIELLIGIHNDGTLRAVRVISHRETPGLGDAIELRRGDWIRQFDQRSLSNPPLPRWRVQRHGGEIDGITSATITAAAVTAAVAEALVYFQRLSNPPANAQPMNPTRQPGSPEEQHPGLPAQPPMHYAR